MNTTANKILKTIWGIFLAVLSCVSSLRALTQEKWLCWAMIGISVALLGLGIYWLSKKKNTDRAKLFIACSLIMIPGSAYKLNQIVKTEERAEQWKSFVDTRYVYNGGYYRVVNPPTDGPSQMDVARKSFIAGDYKTAREYAEKALGQGVCEAATMLIDMYYYGLGVAPDMHEVVKYLSMGMQSYIIDYSIDSVLVQLEKKNYVITERERMLLDKRRRDNDYLLQTIDDMRDAAMSSRKELRQVLKSHHIRNEELALSGSITATQLLYMECIEDQWQGGKKPEDFYEQLWKYSDMMMLADGLPTDPYSRVQACVIHDGERPYKASNVDYFIKHNAYPELCPASGPVNYKKDYLENDLKDPDEYLFAKYRLYRAQYEYYKSFMVTDRRKNYLLCYQYGGYNIVPDLVKANKMLEDIIVEIFNAMPTLDKSDEGSPDTVNN